MLMSELADLDTSRNYDGIALYSGGTDSTLAPLLARKVVGENILLLMIDLGETLAAKEQAVARATAIGWDLLMLDKRVEFADEILSEAIRMRASYWGYPLGTPLGRAFQLETASRVLDVLNAARERRRYVIHGCAARQNTRFRIERYIGALSNVEPVGPFVEQIVARHEKVALLEQYGIEATPGDGVATDQNIYCRALEGDLLNTLEDPSSLAVYTTVAPLHEAVGSSEVHLTFKEGIPVAIDGEPRSLSFIIEECRDRAASLGIGRICVFEDTVPELGYKERGIYEAPAAVILAGAHRYLEGATLSLLHRRLLRSLRQRWADVVYRGDWHTAERNALGVEGARYNAPISGSVTLKLWPGGFGIGEAECEDTLLVTSEEARGAY